MAIASVGSLSGIVSGISGGPVTISYTVATGCSATYVVSVNGVPPISGIANMCAWSDTLLLHDSNPAGTYSSTLVTVVNLGGGSGRVIANAPGTATVTYTLTTGCFLTTMLTVNPLPGSITGGMNICAGSSITGHNTTLGGTWSSSSPGIAAAGSLSGIITGISAGIALITYALPTGCKTDTPVHVLSAPAPIAVLTTLLPVGSSTTFADAIAGGIWASSNTAIATAGAGSGIIAGISVGVATISYTLGSGCAVTKMVTVTALSGVHPGEGNINVYPNPNRGDFIIQGNLWDHTSLIGVSRAKDEQVSIEISDLLGKEVYRHNARLQGGNLDVRVKLSDSLPNGMYILTLRSSDQIKIFHLVVEQ